MIVLKIFVNFWPKNSRYKILPLTNYLFINSGKVSERMLYPLEKPVKILSKLLIDAGYFVDEITDMVREDNSYLCRFIYREVILNSTTSLSESNSIKNENEEIIIRKQNLETVPVYLYKNAERIKSMELSLNLLLDFPLDFAQLCISLTKLRLSQNEYEKIPDSLHNIKGLKSLDLSNNKITKLDSGQLHLLPDLDRLIFCNNQISIIPDDYSMLTKLTVLDLSNNCLESFPLPICHLYMLKYLNLSFNNIKSIPSLFGELSFLQSLLLINNELSGKLPECFGSLSSLINLDIRKNKITDISVLSELTQLESLKCDQNSIETFVYRSNDLMSLSIKENPLSKFHCLSFAQIVILNLSHCNLKDLPSNFFNGMDTLTEVNLSNNKISKIPKDDLLKLVRLEVFLCTNNRLEFLPDELFALPRLLQIDVHNNNIRKLPPGIWFSPSLYYFNASTNMLAEFPARPQTVSNVSGSNQGSNKSRLSLLTLTQKLRHLILADNRLTDYVFSPISLLQHLQILNLSCNDISEVPPGGLYHLTSLTELYLSGNTITSFPAEEIERLRHLKIFYLNSNKLSSLPAELRKLGKLVVLDVGNNQLKYNISNWNYDWNWNYNKDLKYLNLSGNKRLKITNASLITSGNKNSPLVDFNELTNLKVLGLIDIDVMATKLDQSQNRRIRTYESVINQVGIGIADRLDRGEILCSWDLIVPNFMEKEDESLFGIFDILPNYNGESRKLGKYLSDWLTFHLTSELRKVEKSSVKDPILRALRCTFLVLQREIVSTFGEEMKECASALIVYRKGETIYYAHIGDVVMVLSRKGEKGRVLTTPHMPAQKDCKDEIKRVRNTGGYISSEYRVNGETRLSRCLGLFHQLPTINASPSLGSLQLTGQDEYLILANRGIWDVISYQTGVEIARTELEDPMIAAQKLRDLAISYGSEGSIMAMVVSMGDLFNNSLQIQRRKTKSRPKYNSDIYRRTVSGSESGDFRYLTQFGNWKKMRNLDNTPKAKSSQAQAPTGMIVICFTSIKNSKYLWENHQDAMQKASITHINVLRRVLEEVNGYEVKDEGDSFMASFSTVASAVLWSCLVQLRLLDAVWPEEILALPDGKEIYDSELENQVLYRGLSIRMGMHYGAPECERDPFTGRMDYFGPMVNKSARVSGEASWGEICVSSDILSELKLIEGLLDSYDDASEFSVVSQELSASSNRDKAKGFQTTDIINLKQLEPRVVELGERKLKGMEQPEPLYLIFPKMLLGRTNPDRYTQSLLPLPSLNIIPPGEIYGQEPTLMELVRTLGQLCIRIETAVHFITTQDSIEFNKREQDKLEFLLSQVTSTISDTITSQELFKTIDSLCTRIENCCTTLAVHDDDSSISEVMDAIQAYLALTSSTVSKGNNSTDTKSMIEGLLSSSIFDSLDATF
ncbi:hypothetical protein K502DRAFT_201960 [Neoconidiobolus thromboides FSU 785]|nr:hypothetical protein K502DRAFT_201960 [Neoconidiobolus thromboides FSU 785]